jgi:hypothetical protein
VQAGAGRDFDGDDFAAQAAIGRGREGWWWHALVPREVGRNIAQNGDWMQ